MPIICELYACASFSWLLAKPAMLFTLIDYVFTLLFISISISFSGTTRREKEREKSRKKKQREITASALLRSYLVTDVLHSSSSADQLAVDRCMSSVRVAVCGCFKIFFLFHSLFCLLYCRRCTSGRCVRSLIRQSRRIFLQVLLLPSSLQSTSSSSILSGQNSSPVQPYNLSSSSLLVFRWLLEDKALTFSTSLEVSYALENFTDSVAKAVRPADH
ncbi:uncharacterized protein LOC129316608 [Prosopis cineraria]|uniref:uncharacterized protein LOC129316608 n=1 Tax=Prosopis cineraria TaxID=364024 RepID=UPI00240EA042|nr:uncharacterized protein LOC129316608 [Prosopis cineraria]